MKEYVSTLGNLTQENYTVNKSKTGSALVIANKKAPKVPGLFSA
jgi:hypothetical protein